MALFDVKIETLSDGHACGLLTVEAKTDWQAIRAWNFDPENDFGEPCVGEVYQVRLHRAGTWRRYEVVLGVKELPGSVAPVNVETCQA